MKPGSGGCGSEPGGPALRYPYIDWSKESDLEAVSRAIALLGESPERGLLELAELADKGSTASMVYLGDAYLAGRYTKKDLDEALKWYALLEARAWRPAPYCLGRTLYRRGDYSAAYEAFLRGADANYGPAIYRFALMHADGRAVEADMDRCRSLLIAAADRGHMIARRDLAGFYLRGTFGILKVAWGAVIYVRMVGEFVKKVVCREWEDGDLDEQTFD